MKHLLVLFGLVSLIGCGRADLEGLSDVDDGDCMPSRRLFGQTTHWPADVAGQTYTVINVAEPVTPCEGAPTTWGIQVQGVINRSAFAGKLDKPSLRADILWGVLGGSFSASFDISKGASFNLVADSVRVDVTDTTVYVGAPATRSPFDVTGAASPVPVPKTQPVTMTLPTTTTPPIAGDIVTVPQFAKRLTVTVSRTAVALTDYEVVFLDATLLNALGSINVGAGGDLVEFPLPGNTAAILINAVGANVLNMYYVFNLDLG